MPVAAAHKTLVPLADGRELIYFDAEAGTGRAAYPDTRSLDPRRQVRPYHPGPDVCPLCPPSARTVSS